MLRIRMVGLALVAVFALSAIAASSASAALPEFGRCKHETGKYSKANCEEGEGSAYNWVPLKEGEEVKFKSTSGAGTLETEGGTKVTCKEDIDEGHTTGPKTDVVTVRFIGCESSKIKCTSAGAASGEIVVKEALSELGFIKAPEVGLALKPAKGSEIFVEFSCLGGIVKVKTKGSVIGKLTPSSEMTETFTLVFKSAGGGKQEIKKFEGGAEDVLSSSINGGAYEPASEETTDTIKFTEKLEVKEKA
jgi:hypothetical protein